MYQISTYVHYQNVKFGFKNYIKCFSTYYNILVHLYNSENNFFSLENVLNKCICTLSKLYIWLQKITKNVFSTYIYLK